MSARLNDNRFLEEPYSTSFSGDPAGFINELDSIDRFLSEQGVESLTRSRIRLSLEEICGAVYEHEKEQKEILTQLTLMPDSDGSVEVHLRNNASGFDPFSIVGDQFTEKSELTGTDLRGLCLDCVRTYAKNLLYRHYQRFNTLTYRI